MHGFLYKITKNGSTGEDYFDQQYQIHNMSVSSIDCTTALEKEVINVGEKPEITVMGIKEREATVKCTFTGVSSIFGRSNPGDGSSINPKERVADGLKNETYLPVTDGAQLEYAIRFTATSRDVNTPAGFVFLQGYWKIKQIIKDQDAKEGGLYRITMVLTYLWETPQETGIFADDTALLSTANNVQFQIKRMEKGKSTWEVMNVLPQNVRITKSLMDFNKATFDTIDEIANEDIVMIGKRGATLAEDLYIFMGIVREVNRGSNGLFRVTCLEVSDILYNTALVGPGTEFDFVYKVPNRNEKQVKVIVSKIIEALTRPYRKPSLKDSRWDPGVGVDKTKGLGSKPTIPNTDADVPTQIFAGTYVGKAIKTFVQDTLGMYLWYNYINKGALEYGFIRDVVTIRPDREVWTTNTYIEENVNDMTPDCVVVFSNDSKSYGVYGNQNTTNVDMYRVTSNVLSQTLSELARRIHTDSNQDTSVFKLRFPAGTVRFKEGDVFTGLGDQTLSRKNMDYRSGSPNRNNPVGQTLWQVKEVIITQAYTDIVVGNSHYSVFDQYHAALSKIQDGVPITTHTVRTYLEKLRSNGVGEYELTSIE